MTNPLLQLRDHGQSVWYDFIHRDLLTSGGLARLVKDDGIRGVTSNPAIFEKAIAKSDAYDTALEALSPDFDAKRVFESLAVEDIRAAADVLRPVYDSSDGRDGFVSLEVSPRLAHDTPTTLSEARRLWAEVDRPNLMIKVPGTEAGLPAIRELIAAGINVNITLLFSRAMYERVVEAYLSGLEDRASAGGDVAGIASVASFFISRIDSAVDAELTALAETATGAERTRIEGLRGRAAIANGKLTYQRYQDLFAGPRWDALAAKGARTQRVLWASTSTKDPSYRDVLYVEELVGPDTVNTVPVATVDAFRDHGVVRDSLSENLDDALETLAELGEVGISLDAVTDELLDQGVELFVKAFDQLLAAIGEKWPSRVS